MCRKVGVDLGSLESARSDWPQCNRHLSSHTASFSEFSFLFFYKAILNQTYIPYYYCLSNNFKNQIKAFLDLSCY